MEGAHRRHQSDPAAGPARLREGGVQFGDRAQRSHRSGDGRPARAWPRSARRTAPAVRERVRPTASRWRRDRRLVPTGHRPGDGAFRAHLQAQFSTLARTSGTSISRVDSRRAARRSAAASSVTRKLDAMEAAAWYATRSSGATWTDIHLERPCDQPGQRHCPLRVCVNRGGRPTEVGAVRGDGHQRVQREGLVWRQRLEARGARAVTDDYARGDRRCSARDLPVRDAEQRGIAACGVRAPPQRADELELRTGAQGVRNRASKAAFSRRSPVASRHELGQCEASVLVHPFVAR